jgi:methylmalonyl-CoA mutase
MTSDNIDAELHAKFPRSTADDWAKIATHELNGKDPFEFLSWRGKDGLLFLPYYDSENDIRSRSAKVIQSAAEQKFSVHEWLNLPIVTSYNEQSANALALEHLLQGADGILFDLRAGQQDLNKLTSNIQWPHCYTGFFVKDDPIAIDSLTRLLQSSDLSNFQVGLFWETIPKKDDFNFYLNGNKEFKSLGIVLSEQPPSQQIANALMQGVKLVEKFSDKHAVENIFSAIAFSVTADAFLLESIAKLRALRRLWVQVAQAYGLKNFKASDLFLHARVTDVPDGSYGPHQNMLNGTFASLGAILGGCDAISVEHDASSGFFARWSRNISCIVREESLLTQTADPFAGSWSIESMTDRLAEHSWQSFQQKW